MRTITKKELVDAIRKNGYTQAFKQLISYHMEGLDYLAEEKVVIGSACAIGQAALNLKVDPWELSHVLDQILVNERNHGLNSLGSMIVGMNDYDRLPLAEIANKLETRTVDFKFEMDDKEWDPIKDYRGRSDM